MNDRASIEGGGAPAPIAGNETLAELWRYWNAKRSARAMPLRKEISPLDIPRLLPHLSLVDRLPSGQFRYRLVGTAVAEAYGFDPTGKTVDEALPEPRRTTANQHYAAAFAGGRAVFTRNCYRTGRVAELVASRIVLPLADESGQTVMLLMGQTFEYDTAVSGEYGAEGAAYAASDHLEYLE